ncbi:alkaline phosphatase D family protein [Gramella lutea]|uniref:Alkaline phosphatase D family protein n=1 Tax=Christiangramia lutea TaxID=1607951 RepID=A0A9X1V2H7_9FLAO|nr:alkaline phosphatase D family protein [Christiangramia lutea]MCH4822620.1 alkaline phosphatase D family protein [Christiangramia lutea]
MRKIREWEWTLVKWEFEMKLEIKKEPPSTSTLLFEYRPTSKGTFKLEDQDFNRAYKLVVWSCNQPFETNENDQPVLHEYADIIFEWYENQIKSIQPNMIWGLGDTGYSDGTMGTDFINQYYDNTQFLNLEEAKLNLLKSYRRMYKAHWSFGPLQKVMRNFPHITIWDDHEIRDGWGSEENDFLKGNTIIYEQARRAAEEFILNNGPRIRPPSLEDPLKEDAHQAYITSPVACFVFDGRSSRRYNDPKGKVISEDQMNDFRDFCNLLAYRKEVKFLIMGSAVPFINLVDFIERIGSDLPDELNELLGELRDDIRDSWHSPGNIGQLKELIGVLRQLHTNRPDMNMINVSGDIHVANLYSFQPMGFQRALYQVTTSALTNRSHPSDRLNELIQVSTEVSTEALGVITRIWQTVSDPNFLKIEPDGQFLKLTLKVFDLEKEELNPEAMDSVKDLVYEVGKHRFVGEHLINA